jgi:hypothetical protein
MLNKKNQKQKIKKNKNMLSVLGLLHNRLRFGVFLESKGRY